MVGSSSCSSQQPANQEAEDQVILHLQTTDLSPPVLPPPAAAVAGHLLHQHQIHHHQYPYNHQPEEEEEEADVEMMMMMMSPSSSTPPQASSSMYLRQLLLTCAQSISRSDFAAAHRITTLLSSKSSPYGDSSERLINSFTKALSLRLHNSNILPPPPPDLISFFNNSNIINTTTATTTTTTTHTADYNSSDDDAILQSSYLSLNQITPFIRFTHLTANQAILEAINNDNHDQYSHHNSNLHQQQRHPDHHDIHILDFDIMQGVQWPPLMQAIADRHPPATLRITATGTNLDILRKTGDRLSKFAHSLGLRFRFFPLLLPPPQQTNNQTTTTVVDDVINHLSAVLLLPNEILAVNCVLYLHRLLTDRDKLCLLLRKIKSMNPRVVTLAENEANHNHPILVSRFEEALSYYAAVFDSLEATLPPNSRERMAVEQVWFGREIADIVAAEGENRRERHERYLSWEMMMRIAGFRNVALSPFALSQAKLLLRLHYPSEGYNLEVVNGSFFLGWQNQPLFSVSSWH